MSPVHNMEVKKWGVFELSLAGPSEGNPFTEQHLEGIFSGKEESKVVEGFYDGDGIYRIRFMPSYTGKYSYVIRASFLSDAMSGYFYVTDADEGQHGPVHVNDVYHFAYADGTPFHPIGTTAYVWHLQDDDTKAETLKYLQEARFNKIRFCVFPKHYVWNLKDPTVFPYEGTPVDTADLTAENFMEYFNKKDENNFDYTRFVPAYFQNVEDSIRKLGEIGVQADLILMHPYDRWGFSTMTKEQDDLYWRYVTARFSAFANVWWSLANEYDLMTAKTTEDWERFGNTLVQKDPYGHLRSIHNCRLMFDHSRPWITHVSFQRIDLYKGAELTDELRARFHKPVLMDEIAYEGNLPYGWGSITPEEMLRRFWETAVRGGYPGHGETYLSDDDKLWWSHGGTLHGESWKRFELLLDVLDEVPGSGLAPMSMNWDDVCAVPENEWSKSVKSMYLFYYSFMRPSWRDFHIDDTTDFVAEVIDTWNMKIVTQGIYHGAFRVELPGKQYMAIRLRKAQEEDYAEFAKKAEEAVIDEATVEEPASVQPQEETAAETAAETAPAADGNLQLLADEEIAFPEDSDDFSLTDDFVIGDTDDLFLDFDGPDSSKNVKVDTIDLKFPEDLSDDDELPDIAQLGEDGKSDPETVNVPVFRYDD
ncbi:MAG: DUF5060 domain-containing protein [Solobacterium sp.]|nr:DUF5060 domain-containing protein [Solobacterium sp.]